MRRLPALPLPTHSFVHGLTPRQQEGWAAGVSDEDAFAYGCDCFDAGFFFEAHEQWERPWLAAKNSGDDDDEALLHGLIRLAAAGVKRTAQHEAGMLAHLAGAAGHFSRIVVWPRGFSPVIVSSVAADLRAGRPVTLP